MYGLLSHVQPFISRIYACSIRVYVQNQQMGDAGNKSKFLHDGSPHKDFARFVRSCKWKSGSSGPRNFYTSVGVSKKQNEIYLISIEVASTVIQALVFWHHFLDRLGPTTLPNDKLNRQLPEGGLPSFQPSFDRRVDKTWSNPLIDEKPSPEDPLWENCKN